MHVGDTMPTRDMPIMDKNNGGTAVGYSATVAKAATVSGVDTSSTAQRDDDHAAELKLYSEFIADFVKFAQEREEERKTVDDVANSWKVPAKYTGYANPTPARVKADAQVAFDETR